MSKKLKIYLSDDANIIFSNFDIAIDFCTKEFGYEGEAWEYVIATDSLDELYEFLDDDDVDVEFI